MDRMRGFVGNTDYDWFTFLRSIEPPIDEVNFWRPGEASFKILQPGEPLFFRLKSPLNAIAGFGTYVYFSRLPSSVAWDTYGPANGAASYDELRARLVKLRSRNEIAMTGREFHIGCILLTEPFFFDEVDWIATPSDWRGNVPPGLAYDLSAGEGRRVWMECLERVARYRGDLLSAASRAGRIADRPITSGYGEPTMFRPRLGQRSFRVAVLDSYGRRCAVTNEKTLPALEAAHIRAYHDVPEHVISNGILLRADIHKLFDTGYVTVAPDYHFLVSRRIKEEFENGRDYYALHGSPIRLPQNAAHHPAADALIWHNEQRYLG